MSSLPYNSSMSMRGLPPVPFHCLSPSILFLYLMPCPKKITMNRLVPPCYLFLTAPWPFSSTPLYLMFPATFTTLFLILQASVHGLPTKQVVFAILTSSLPPLSLNWILNGHCPLPTSQTVSFEYQLCVYCHPHHTGFIGSQEPFLSIIHPLEHQNPEGVQ